MESSYEKFKAVQNERRERLREQLSSILESKNKLTLEIGCGHGHFLTAFAEANKETTCVGIDLVTKRIEKAIAKKEKRNLDNLHFIKAEVKDFISVLPEDLKIERIFILFPDPWPKKRHAKNRIIQDELLTHLADHSRSETQLHFRTDHEGQFAWGLDKLALHEKWEIDEESEWPFEKNSFFQDLMDDYFSVTAQRAD